ncbi:MAG: 3-isopropylmalate dehydratase large subunit [Mahellales bacterium]|jgi:3-isopropylmalate/(R)-2-methylmalate dehydratase large subunit
MGQTIAEKIFSNKTGNLVYADDIVTAKIDFLVSHDGLGPMAIDSFKEMNGVRVKNPDKVCFVIDHFVPSPARNYSLMQQKVKDFCYEQGITFYDGGEGICHQVAPEKGYIVPGDLIIGTDSHTCTYGALNAFATGIGSTDAAAALKTGELWFRVPKTIKIVFNGKLQKGVYAKDLILYLVGRISADGANYKAIEFSGETINALGIEDRFTICNMSIEMGAKAGIMLADKKTELWLKGRTNKEYEPVFPDSDAKYDCIHEYNACSIEPQVAQPHQVDDVIPVKDIKNKKIHQAIIGTCTNGRLEDLRTAARMLENKKLAKGVRLIVVPASRTVLLKAIEQGIIETFVDAGGMIVTPGCGPCVGSHSGIPSDGETVISTANRNFKGRSGNANASVYLASPATVAASAITGYITDPRDIIGG